MGMDIASFQTNVHDFRNAVETTKTGRPRKLQLQSIPFAFLPVFVVIFFVFLN